MTTIETLNYTETATEHHEPLRSIKVTYSDGQTIHTSMAAHLDDDEMLSYYKVGKWFNLANGIEDNMQQIVSAEITDGRKVGLTLLVDMKTTAGRAFYWQSFNPEKRAKNTLKEHEEELIQDMEHIRSISDETTAQRYCVKYKSKMSAWLNSESNCASSAVTGGSNFPQRQQEKRHNWAHNAYGEFREFRKRMIAAIEKAQRRAAKAQIDPIQDLQQRIADKVWNHAIMKEINVLFRKVTDADQRIKMLGNYGIEINECRYILKSGGFRTFSLTNNLSEIKRLQDRLAVETKKAAISEKVGGNLNFQFDGYEVIINFDMDRIQVKHEQKPSPDIIQTLKKIAFKWSPSQGVWQRQLTANAVHAFNYTFNLDIKVTA